MLQDSNSLMMVRALISHFFPSNEEAAFHCFSKEQSKMLKASPKVRDPHFNALLSDEEWLADVHYSWFYPPLAKSEEGKRALLLSYFEGESKSRLSSLLKMAPPLKKLSSLLRPFIACELKNMVRAKKEVLPKGLLPDSDLSELLVLSKPKLLHLIDLLGIHDLAAELRHIIDREILMKVRLALSQEQLNFLQYASKQSIKWTAPSLNIEGWGGDKKTLALTLHKRGLIRLGRALAKESESFKWHLCHRLDTGRGGILMKLFEVKEDPAMISYFKGQVLHLIKRYRK